MRCKLAVVRVAQVAVRVWATGLIACGGAYDADDVMHGSHSHIPPIAREAAQGAPLDGNTELVLSVAMPLRNADALEQTLQDLYDPNSPQYGKFLSPAEFAARHHPTAEEVADVRAALVERGLSPEQKAHGCLLMVHGRAADVEDAFATALYHYTGHDGSRFVAPTNEPSAPNGIKLSAVHGLVHGLRPRTLYHRFDKDSVRGADSERAHAFALASNTLTGGAIRSVYDVPADASGKGQVVGLFQLDSFDPVDLAQFASNNGLPAPNVTAIRMDGATAAVVDGNTQVEVQLDIMMAMAMAPNAEIRLYQGQSAGGSSGYQYYLNVFNEMANPTLGDQKLVRNLSTSYGYFEAQLSTATLQSEAVIFKQMAAQGQSLFGAAGDSGALGYNSSGQQVVTVVDPAVQPYVVAVGGTSVSVASGGRWQSETTWSGGGGGVSRLWQRPSYQAMLSAQPGAYSSTLRNAPDVAMNADPNTGFQIVLNRRTIVVGGTSAAAPLWASVNALINERRASAGVRPLGFFNPALYHVCGQAGAQGVLHDITTGSNGKYAAAVGYDNTTGWGSPSVSALLDAMSGGYPRVPFTAPDWPL